METPKRASLNVGNPIPGNNPVRVNDTRISPYCFAGLLRLTVDEGWRGVHEYIGTGTLIAEPGKTSSSYVLTCAHNLYNYIDEKVLRITFLRGYNSPDTIYPEMEAVDWFFPAEYANANANAVNINFDYGLIKLKSPVELGVPLPQLVVKSTEELIFKPVQLNGYGWFNEAMSHATGLLREPTGSSLLYPISTKRAASGTAIMDTNNLDIVGIHTRARPDENLNQGIRITESVKKEIEGWMR